MTQEAGASPASFISSAAKEVCKIVKRRRTLSSKASSWLFILPALTVVILLLLYPVTSSIFYSLTNKNLIKPTYRFLGLDNYIKTLTDPDFWTAFWNDLKWTFFSLLGQLIVGFTGALALNRIKKALVFIVQS